MTHHLGMATYRQSPASERSFPLPNSGSASKVRALRPGTSALDNLDQALGGSLAVAKNVDSPPSPTDTIAS